MKELLEKIGINAVNIPETEAIQAAVTEMIDALPPRSARVLRKYYGIDCSRVTLNAIGVEENGITGSRVMQIRNKALRMMKHPSRRGKLDLSIEAAIWKGGHPQLLALRDGVRVLEAIARPIDELGLPIRFTNVLKAEEILYIGDLIQRSEVEVISIPMMHYKGLKAIKEALASRGLALGTKLKNWPPAGLGQG